MGDQRRGRRYPDVLIVTQRDRGLLRALRYFALDGTFTPATESGSLWIDRNIVWRNRDARNGAVRQLGQGADVVGQGSTARLIS